MDQQHLADQKAVAAGRRLRLSQRRDFLDQGRQADLAREHGNDDGDTEWRTVVHEIKLEMTAAGPVSACCGLLACNLEGLDSAARQV